MHPYDNFKLSATGPTAAAVAAGVGGVGGAGGGLPPGVGGGAGVGGGGGGGLGHAGTAPVDERYEDRGYQYPLTDKQRPSFQEPVDDKEVRQKEFSVATGSGYITLNCYLPCIYF